jgi:hypothetical protein
MDPKTIANWTPEQLRQFIVNQVLPDPGSYPKTVAQPGKPASGDVPIWSGSNWGTRPYEQPGMVLLQHNLSPNNASTIFDQKFDGTGFTHLRAYYYLNLSAGGLQGVDIRLNNDSAISYGYLTQFSSPGTNMLSEAASVDGGDRIRLGVTSAASAGMAILDIAWAFTTKTVKHFQVTGYCSGDATYRFTQGYWQNGQVLNELVTFAANNFSSQTECTVYGIR